MSNFGSSVETIRKASTHLSGEPIDLPQTVVNNC